MFLGVGLPCAPQPVAGGVRPARYAINEWCETPHWRERCEPRLRTSVGSYNQPEVGPLLGSATASRFRDHDDWGQIARSRLHVPKLLQLKFKPWNASYAASSCGCWFLHFPCKASLHRRCCIAVLDSTAPCKPPKASTITLATNTWARRPFLQGLSRWHTTMRRKPRRAMRTQRSARPARSAS